MIRFALGRIKFGAGATAVAPSHGPGVDTGTVTPEESSLTPTAPSDGGVTVLRITDIQPYEKNPRHAANPLFDTIKASIRQRGMDAPLKVTRRPGATHYVVAAGGNTRLLAQLQLWQETADPRFETVPVVIKAWRSESDVLAGHLIENEQRSDLTFWDKARGVVALKAELEQERAAALSLRQWESALADLGLPIGKNVLSTLPVCGGAARSLGAGGCDLEPQRCARPPAAALPDPGPPGAEIRSGRDRACTRTRSTRSCRGSRRAIRPRRPSLRRSSRRRVSSALAQTLQIAVPTLQAMLALLDQSPELALDRIADARRACAG